MKNVICLLEEQVEQNSERIALMDEEISLTYFELWEKIKEVADVFAENGIISGMMVSICIDSSKEKIVAMLAVLYLRAKFIVFEKDKLSLQQIQDLLYESRCQSCIKLDKTQDGYFNYKVVNTENKDIKIDLCTKCEDDVIYYITTSGSTGKAKLVPKTNKDIVSSIINIKYNTKLFWGGTGLQFCSFHFAFAYIELFSQLLLGNTIFCYPAEERINVRFLCDIINRNNVDTIFMPTVVFNLLSKSAKILLDFPKTLKQIIVAGEKLSVDEKMADVLIANNVSLFNYYGCAEIITICIHQCSLRTDDLMNVPVGKKNMFINFKIIGERTNEGCLYVYNVYNEYYGDLDDLSAYHNTGDLCRINESGEISIIGRCDNQIKINGCRIDIDDVQHYILKLNVIKECCICLVPFGIQEKTMFAFITTNYLISKDEIIHDLKEVMPEYMIPSFIEIVSKIDVLPSGKFDKVKMSKKATELIDKRKRILDSIYEEDVIIDMLKKMTGIMDKKENILNMKLSECGLDSITFAFFLTQIEKQCMKKIICNELGVLRDYTLEQFIQYVNNCDNS